MYVCTLQSIDRTKFNRPRFLNLYEYINFLKFTNDASRNAENEKIDIGIFYGHRNRIRGYCSLCYKKSERKTKSKHRTRQRKRTRNDISVQI